MTGLIADGIRYLYVMTGRGLTFDENKFVKDDKDEDLYLYFTDDLPLDEKAYV